jgi:hypothetical protein
MPLRTLVFAAARCLIIFSIIFHFLSLPIFSLFSLFLSFSRYFFSSIFIISPPFRRHFHATLRHAMLRLAERAISITLSLFFFGFSRHFAFLMPPPPPLSFRCFLSDIISPHYAFLHLFRLFRHFTFLRHSFSLPPFSPSFRLLSIAAFSQPLFRC